MKLGRALAALAIGMAAASSPAAQYKVPPPDPSADRRVAMVFGTPVTAADLQWRSGTSAAQPAERLRSLVLREALERFIADEKLQATDEDMAAFRDWERRSRRVEARRRTEQRTRIETELNKPGLPEDTYLKLKEAQAALDQLDELDRRRDAQLDDERTLRVWIEGHKARKAMYDKYGGRVGITSFGPNPVGATEALLREHEKAGRLQILDAELAQSFWEGFIREPQQPARPDQIDFTYYWLKPVTAGRP